MAATGLVNRGDSSVLYAWACAIGAAAGTILGIFVSGVLPVGISLAVSAPSGFLAGALVGPVACRFFAQAGLTAGDEFADLREPAPPLIESSANRASPYTFAAAWGSLVGCVLGILAVVLPHLGPLPLFASGGFILGAAGGIAYEVLFGGPDVRNPTAHAGHPQASA